MTILELQTVKLDVDGGVARVALNRPEALNAWTADLGRDLTSAFDHASSDDAVRAIVLTGEGRAFSSGADLKAERRRTPEGHPDVLYTLREIYNPLILKVRTIPKPVVAAVNGPAVGIGCSLALAADMIVAAESAYFLLAFVNIGLGVDGGASAFLPARVGHARAFEIAYLGERVSATQALEWGLINRVAADGSAESVAGELAARFAAGPPGSYANIKRTINEHEYRRLEQVLDLEAVLQQDRAASNDFREGVMAFREKRRPQFTGT